MSVVSFEQALATVLEHARKVQAPPAEAAPLLESMGRVLAKPIVADRDQPPFDRATRDGFAVRAAEWGAGKPLCVVGQVRAGEIWRGGELPRGAALEIMTGAPVPSGADAVAMLEHVVGANRCVEPVDGRLLAPGENVVRRGSEARAGEVVAERGTVITAAEIAEAASCGLAELEVGQRPKVAIVATGDELVELKESPAEHQIRNSNGYALAALVAAGGGEPRLLPIARDTHEDLRARLLAAKGADLLLLSGGVSAGKYDLVEEVLAEFGAEFFFTGVKMQPGKPVVFGRVPAERLGGEGFVSFFGLPGNPVSTEVTFHCFAGPLLRAMAGAGVTPPKFAQATLEEDVAAKEGLTRVLPARWTAELDRPSVRLVQWRGSGDLAANARANCYVVLREGGEDRKAGDVVPILLR